MTENVNPKLLIAYRTMVKVAIRIIQERREQEKIGGSVVAGSSARQ